MSTLVGERWTRQKRTETLQFSKMRLSQARAVLRHSRATAEGVIRGTTTLDKALQDVQDDENEEQKRARRLRQLHDERPDLPSAAGKPTVDISLRNNKKQRSEGDSAASEFGAARRAERGRGAGHADEQKRIAKIAAKSRGKRASSDRGSVRDRI